MARLDSRVYCGKNEVGLGVCPHSFPVFKGGGSHGVTHRESRRGWAWVTPCFFSSHVVTRWESRRGSSIVTAWVGGRHVVTRPWD